MRLADLDALEAALHALEHLHDEPELCPDRARDCVCQIATNWRRARRVVVELRERTAEHQLSG